MTSPIEVFCCYARKDQTLFAELKAHLMPLQRQGLVTIWSDTDINAGEAWEEEIEKHLETAQIILLLISPDFMNSDYCYSKELKRAMERRKGGNVRLIPIILRPTAWKEAPFGKLQALPKNALPVTRWENQDEAFISIAEGIRKVVGKLNTYFESRIIPKKLALVHKLKAGEYTGYSVAISPDGHILASGSSDKTVKLWNLDTGELLRTLKEHTPWIGSVAFSFDGHTLASGGSDGIISIWNLDTGEILHSLKGHTSWINSVAFSFDGHTLASGSSDKTIKLWNLDTGEILHSLGDDRSLSSVYSVAISLNGQTLLSGGYDSKIRVWNLNTMKLRLTLEGHLYSVYSVVISPDGRTLASGGLDGIIRIWNLDTGELLRTLKKHSGLVLSIAISPDGHTLASGSGDETIKLWNLDTGELLRTLNTDTSTYSVAISPDGHTLASRYMTGYIDIWKQK